MSTNTNTNTYLCNTCDKKYTRKSSLEKHIVLCEFLTRTKREKQILNEEDRDIPSYHQLVNIVQELSIKYNALENQLSEMQKWVEKKKKKINVVSWLNMNIEPTMHFQEWTNSFVIHEEHFQFLMGNTITDCFQHILEEHLTTPAQIYPIKCFSQKSNLFYIFTPEKEWRQMAFEDFTYLLKIIQSKLLKSLSSWKIQNKK